MNYHSDDWIAEQMNRHLENSKSHFPMNNIVGIFLQGSQNYQLDTKESDIDTKLIITPSFKDIALNKKPVSTTHILPNEEHIDFKDIRLYIETFKKQNLNFLEILFTKYFFINPYYQEDWNLLVKNRELIARMNPCRGVKAMYGIALNKFKALSHPYPSKEETLGQYGYDPKQLHHLVRVKIFLDKFAAGAPYAECLIPTGEDNELLQNIKTGIYTLKEAEEKAKSVMSYITNLADDFCNNTENKTSEEAIELLSSVQFNIMKKSVEKELNFVNHYHYDWKLP